jgi:hypothetical protein
VIEWNSLGRACELPLSHPERRQKGGGLDAVSIQKVLKPLGLAITLKVRPIDPFAAVLLTETSGY